LGTKAGNKARSLQNVAPGVVMRGAVTLIVQ
jgi:hypothetical protein